MISLTKIPDIKMKRIISFTLCLVLASCRFAGAQVVFKNNDLSISKLKEKVWVVETTDMTTMYIIEGTKKAMLIDTGTKCDSLDKIAGKITQKPLYVVLTHNHPDHAGNIGYFDEVYMHPLDTVIPIGVPFKGKYRWLGDGDVFDLGDRKLEVRLMPGHTPGSIILIDKKDGAVYTGDAFGSGQVWLQLQPQTPMATYVQACERMEKIMDEQQLTEIYCGHYPYLKRPLNKEYIVRMKQLGQRLAAGDTKGAMPYPGPKVGCDNPMMLSDGPVMIVYDPDYIQQPGNN
jgi:glyoxylase-like metal-dependent hydrolase (beta-lactamase superfamily II)